MNNLQIYFVCGLAWTALCLAVMPPYTGRPAGFIIATAIATIFWPVFVLVTIGMLRRRNRKLS